MKYFTNLLCFICLIFLSGLPTLLLAQNARLSNWKLENIPEIPDRVIDRLAQYNQTRSARLCGWLPEQDGMIISTRFGEHYQLHLVEEPGGARQQITFSELDGVNNALMRPNHNGFLTRLDVAEGGEIHQLYYYDLETRQQNCLTDGQSNHLNPVWSEDGQLLAYARNNKNQGENELYLLDIDNQKEIHYSLGAGAWYPLDWSEKSGRLLIANLQPPLYRLYTFDWKNNQLYSIKLAEKEAFNFNQASFDQTGTGVFLSSADLSNTQHLYHIQLDNQQLTNISADLKWEVDNFWLSPNRNRLLFSTNENGLNPIYAVELTDFSLQKLIGIPEGLIYSLHLHPDNQRMAFVLNNAQQPGDIYSYAFETHITKRWTFSEVGGLKTTTFASGTFFTYPTFDSLNNALRHIPAFIYKPKVKKGPFPVLINIHGGPQAQHLPYFSANLQFMATELGIAVIGPNVRGSIGYGDDFFHLDDGFQREDAVKDIGKLLDWIETQPDLDASRIAVYGGSYGGYMSLASMVHFNDRLKCGIDLVGVSDWVTFLENTRDSGRDRRRAEYGDERIPEVRQFLKSISPATHADKISKPLLIAQGLNDPRVPAGQSELMVKTIRENGGTVWYMMARDEGHGFRSRENISYFRQVLAVFLEEYLLE